MKNLLYVIAGLLVLIWIILFKPTSAVHLWLAFAGLVIIIRVIFDKQLSGPKTIKKSNSRTKKT